MAVRIRPATPEDLPGVRAFYAAQGYGGGVASPDQVFLVEHGEELIGAVRLAPEEGVTVLRGMQIRADFQRRGIGTRLLEVVADALGGRRCFCIPYEHLIAFYGQIGFEVIEPVEAPHFLSERLSGYRGRADKKRYVLMCRPGS